MIITPNVKLHMDLFKNVIDLINTTFGVAAAATLVILGLAFWLTFFITKKATKINNDYSNFNEARKVVDTSFDNIREQIASINGKQSSIKESLDKLEQSLFDFNREISYIKGTIDIIRATSPALMNSNSPISFTKEGVTAMNELDGPQIVSNSWSKIEKSLNFLKHETAYKIQEYCIQTASVDPEQFFSDEDIRAVEDFAFQKGYPASLYLRALGLLVRDRYFLESDNDDLRELGIKLSLNFQCKYRKSYAGSISVLEEYYNDILKKICTQENEKKTDIVPYVPFRKNYPPE